MTLKYDRPPKGKNMQILNCPSCKRDSTKQVWSLCRLGYVRTAGKSDDFLPICNFFFFKWQSEQHKSYFSNLTQTTFMCGPGSDMYPMFCVSGHVVTGQGPIYTTFQWKLKILVAFRLSTTVQLFLQLFTLYFTKERVDFAGSSVFLLIIVIRVAYGQRSGPLLPSVWTQCVHTYLSKLVYLLDHGSKQCTHALVNQTLHVMDRLLIWEVQSELVLHLETTIVTSTVSVFSVDYIYTPFMPRITQSMKMYLQLTFLTVLSGSRAMSGILASTMRENRLRIRLEYLKLREGRDISP